MQRSLFLLTVMLSGQVFLSSCHLYEYHLIEEGKTWEEAQEFCKDNYTDLATVSDMIDTSKLKRLMQEKNVTAAWIGLHSKPGKVNRRWHWSLPNMPEVELGDVKAHFCDSKPNDHRGNLENCVEIINGKLNDWQCDKKRGFVCFNETTERVKVKNDAKNWKQAQKYCREHHTDLISGLDQLEKINNKLKWWISLFRDTWRWSDGNDSSFRNWASEEFKDGVEKKECATVTKGSGKWSSDDCNETKPFFCYDDQVILVKKKLTWDEALDHCRCHHSDLVSITNTHQQKWVQARAKKASTSHVWLGLRYTCTMDLWFWVSDHLVCYSNWKDTEDSEDQCVYTAAMEKGGEQEWVKKADTDKFNAICARSRD